MSGGGSAGRAERRGAAIELDSRNMAARVLRAEHPQLVIVVYSGFEASEFEARALDCGADRYVEKGARGMEQVAQALQQLLGEGRDAPLP